MTEISGDDTRIRIMHGGPFHGLMARLGMRRRAWRAFVFAGLSWVLPLMMILASGVSARDFLYDWGAWAKFLLAPVLLTLAEKPIGFAIDECCSILFGIPLVATQSQHDAAQALRTARDRTESRSAETICLLIAAGASVINAASFLGGNAPSWAADGGDLTIAAIWCIAVSNSLYWFLLSRLVWKHLIWAGFLSGIAKCRLRLVVTHPDAHGGLGFLGLYPAGYVLFTLAVSSVAAAGVGHVMERQTVTPTLFAIVCGAWLVVVTLYYALPLTRLSARIAALKRRAFLLSVAKATDYERWSERATFGDNIFSDEAEPEVPEFHDIKPVWTASMKTSALLINRSNLLPILGPAILPMLVAGAFFLSYAQLGPMVKRLLLL
jgi:hypothetical protein